MDGMDHVSQTGRHAVAGYVLLVEDEKHRDVDEAADLIRPPPRLGEMKGFRYTCAIHSASGARNMLAQANECLKREHEGWHERRVNRTLH